MSRRLAILLALVSPTTVYGIGTLIDPDIQLRGDANSDDTVNVTDVSSITNYLFMGGVVPPCMNQADVNNDGVVSLSDAIYLSNWLYSGGPAPPPVYYPPGSSCGVDDTPTGCIHSPCR